MAVTALERWTWRLEFEARQGVRVAWYAGSGAAMHRMVRRIKAGFTLESAENAFFSRVTTFKRG